ncbi:transposase [candidate division KSB1 bacterium]|nr:transposase [candidate division KSB1 bacterium]
MFFRVDKRLGRYTNYKHSPAHLFIDKAYYIITAHTLKNIKPFFNDNRKKLLFDSIIFNFVERNSWELIAFFVGNNHYHILLNSGNNSKALPIIIKNIHRYTAIKLNKIDNKIGRQVWYQYWDTIITSEKSFYARFNYIHYNPVKHGYVKKSEDYKFCSYGYYYEKNKEDVIEIMKKYPFDRVKVKEPK